MATQLAIPPEMSMADKIARYYFGCETDKDYDQLITFLRSRDPEIHAELRQ